jgi:adenine-specific DNA-methyltransferase
MARAYSRSAAVAQEVLSIVSLAEARPKSLTAYAQVSTLEVARATAHAAAAGLWHALLAAQGLAPDSLPLPQSPAGQVAISQSKRHDAAAFGANLAALKLPDAVAELGQLYSHALPKAHRSQTGVFYTPAPLAALLVDRATAAGMDWQRGRAISPACGAGQFLLEDALRMIAAMGDADPAIVVASIGARLRGWDSDPFACFLAQLAVEAALLPHMLASGKRLPPITECRDSLLAPLGEHEGAYDLANENPAFGKVKKTPALARRYARSQRGHMNLYGLFSDLCLRLIKPGGIAALLTPTSYLGGEYFAKLRSLLHQEARPASIDLVESRQDVFPDVLQEVAISVFVRGRTQKRARCAVIHAEPAGLRIQPTGYLCLPPNSEAPWIIARAPGDVPLVTAMHAMPTRLAAWGYRVKTGPLVPHKNLAHMKRHPSSLTVPVVWAECVTTDGSFLLRCDRATRTPFYEPKSAKDANLVTTPCLLLQRTTAKEQHRRLIGAIMTAASITAAGGRVAVENHLNMLVPLTAKAPVSLAMLAKFFASKAADAAFRCISGSVAVSATELEAMPLPTLEQLKAALAAPDSEAVLCRLYGIDYGKNARTSHVRSRKPRTLASDAGNDPGFLG